VDGDHFRWHFLMPSMLTLFKEKWIISRAVASAKSIRLEHYRIDYKADEKEQKLVVKEQILAAKDLAPEDFHRINDAFPVGLDIGFPFLELMCLFNPHHRIIMTDASGKVTTVQVCFECDHFSILHGDQKYGDVVRTPFIWMTSLRNFFAEEGMPNSPDLYRPHYSEVPETHQAPATNN
jgi:hypothetical protein